MTAHQMRGLIAAAVIVIGAGALGRVSGQSSQPVRGDDVLPALLVEVKGLRAAMEQMSSAGPRVQLFVGRLQMQEGRIAGMVRRLDSVRDSAASAQREYDQVRATLTRLAADTSHPGSAQDREDALSNFRAQTAAAKASVDRLRAEEAQLTSDLSIEQSRWTEINQRLDELERSLAVRR